VKVSGCSCVEAAVLLMGVEELPHLLIEVEASQVTKEVAREATEGVQTVANKTPCGSFSRVGHASKRIVAFPETCE